VANVLIVDDEPSLLHALRYNLSRAGHDVRLCTNGGSAVEMVRENPPDLLLLDLMLPGMDGLEVCRKLRREVTNPAVSQLPILMLTARDEEIDKVVRLEVGADDCTTVERSSATMLAPGTAHRSSCSAQRNAPFAIYALRQSPPTLARTTRCGSIVDLPRRHSGRRARRSG
jgi:two-component system alkaline phosphatase synthesis response regulator PhoP